MTGKQKAEYSSLTEQEVCYKICMYENRMNCKFIKDNCDLFGKMKKGIIIGFEKGRESALKELLQKCEESLVYFGTPTLNKLKEFIKEMGVEV